MKSADPPRSLLRLRLDTAALAQNWQALDRLSGSASAGAAIKADAYGLGLDVALPALRGAGARDFFVAHMAEVPAALAHVPAEQISVLHGPVWPEDAQYAKQTGVKPVINSLAQAQRWLDAGGGLCDVMIDTGINRLGLPMSQIGDPLLAKLEIGTLMSHLASADEDVAQNNEQLCLFREAAAHLPAARRSLGNSAGIALGMDYAFDLTRPGLSLYGGIPRGELAQHIRQVAYPQAAILQLRELSAGDKIGYNATFTAPRAMTVATISIGYADGYLRCWSNAGLFRFGGHDLPVLGRVSMDMVVVDCTSAPMLREGDWVDLPYDLPARSEQSGLSQYELLTLLGERFLREG